jgi:hypothetical protein
MKKYECLADSSCIYATPKTLSQVEGGIEVRVNKRKNQIEIKYQIRNI